MSNRVDIEYQGNIAHVILNRSDKRNAMDEQMFMALDQAIKQLKKDKQLRAVILSGKGVDFCSGLDVKSVEQDRLVMYRFLKKWLPWRANLVQRVVQGWRTLPVPVICAVHGRCYGGATQLALGCDFRIGSPDSEYSIMESRWGLIPDMAGSLTLRHIMNLDRAMQLTMTSELIAAPQALEFGLISEIADEPLAKAEQMAAAFSARSPDAIAAIKKLYYKVWSQNSGRLMARESLYQTLIITNKNCAIAKQRELGNTELEYLARRSFW